MPQPFTPQIVVPAFFTQPNLGDHTIVQGLAPAVPLVVLDANVWHAPPTDPYVIDNWRKAIQAYQNVGIKVLGYVPTDSGTGNTFLLIIFFL